MATQESAICVSSPISSPESFYSGEYLLTQNEEPSFDSLTDEPHSFEFTDTRNQFFTPSYENLTHQQDSSSCSSPNKDASPRLPTFDEAVSSLIHSVAQTQLLSTYNQLLAISGADDTLNETLTQAKEACDKVDWSEELDVDNLALILIAKVQDGTEHESQFYTGEIEVTQSKGSRPIISKIDAPLVDTDIESDVRRISDLELWETLQVREQRKGSRWEDDGKGLGGFGWMKKEVDKVKELVMAIENTIDLDDLENPIDIAELTDLSKVDWSDFHGVEGRGTYTYSRVQITPPLSPVYSAEESEDEAVLLFLDMLSEGPDLADTDLAKIERRMEEEDALASSDPIKEPKDLIRRYSPLGFMEESSPFFEEKRLRPTQMRVEVPLSSGSIAPLAEEMGKTTISSVFKEYESWREHDVEPSSQSDLDELVRLLSPLAAKAIRDVEQEPLTNADATTRVAVPILPLASPNPPWLDENTKSVDYLPTDLQITRHKAVIVKYKQSCSKDILLWPGATKIERQLPWNPFPKELGSIAVQEIIEDDGLLQKMVDMMLSEDVAPSNKLISDLHSLQIEDDYFLDDEEIKFGDFDIIDKDVDVFDDGMFMARAKESTVFKAFDIQQPGAIAAIASRMSIKRPFEAMGEAKTTDSSLEYVFNTGAFNRFLVLNNVSPSKRLKPNTAEKTNRPREYKESIEPEELQLPTPPLVPDLPLVYPLPATCVFVSSTIYDLRHSLFRRLNEVYPNTTYIERDFSTLYLEPGLDQRDEQGQRQEGGGRAFGYDPGIEADFILSPSTGLLLTTLQRIQQVNLPGQAPTPSAFRQRLAQVAVRHERVIVLVSQAFETEASADMRKSADYLIVPQTAIPRQIPLPPLTPRQTASFASLCAYASALPSDVLVHFVPAGERELTIWIARQISQFGKDAVIRSEETLWEQLLRRAGVNAYAACWILTDLKRTETSMPMPATEEQTAFGLPVKTIRAVAAQPSAMTEADGMGYGLSAFVTMTPKEREERFSRILGGRRVLDRVSRYLAQEWRLDDDDFAMADAEL